MATGTLSVPPKNDGIYSELDTLYEVVNGERREVLPMGALAGSVASILAQIMGTFAAEIGRGLVVVENLFKLTVDAPRKRRPDVAFFSFEKLKSQPALEDDPEYWDFAPDLAIEVNSRTNTADEILDKVDEYFRAGVKMVWVIYPRQRLIYVYVDSPTNVRILGVGDELDGGRVLPGFQLPLARLFAALVPPG